MTTVTRYRDRIGDAVAFRIVADSRISVAAEIERISGLCADAGWVRFMGPYRYFDTWVCYGELRERLDA